MNAIVSDFLCKSVDSFNTSCNDLLESARALALFLKENDFASYCEKEIHGYELNDKSVPQYRHVELIKESGYSYTSDEHILGLLQSTKETTPYIYRDPISNVDEFLKQGKRYDSGYRKPFLAASEYYRCREIIELQYFQEIKKNVRAKVNDWKNQMIKEGKIKMDQETTPTKVEINNYGGQNINNTGSISGPISQSSEMNSFDFQKAKDLINYIKEQLKCPEISKEDLNLLSLQIKQIDGKITKKESKGLTDMFSALGTWAQNITCSVIGSDIYQHIHVFLQTATST